MNFQLNEVNFILFCHICTLFLAVCSDRMMKKAHGHNALNKFRVSSCRVQRKNLSFDLCLTASPWKQDV